MNSFTAVFLIATIITGEGKPNIQYRVPMPDMETCELEAKEFRRLYKPPDSVDAKGLAATCSGKLAEENPS
jgi:hypothetical protein